MHIDVSPYSERLEELAQKAGISESSWFICHYYSRFYNILQISNENHITNDEFVYKLREFKSLYDGMSEAIRFKHKRDRKIFQLIDLIMKELEADMGINLYEPDVMHCNTPEDPYFPRSSYRIIVKEEYNTRIPHFHITSKKHPFDILAQNKNFDMRVLLNGEIMNFVFGADFAEPLLPSIRENIKKWLVSKPESSYCHFNYNIQMVMNGWVRQNWASCYCDILEKEIDRLQTEEVNLDTVYTNVKSHPKFEYNG